LKILAKKGCFRDFEWEKQISSLLTPHPRKILEKLPSGNPLEKILPTPMLGMIINAATVHPTYLDSDSAPSAERLDLRRLL